jgi:hypothetical protein
MHIHNPKTPPPIEELRLSKLNLAMERGRYTWEKKYSVVAVYLQNGSLRETEAKTGVPAATLEKWRKDSWWPDLVNQIKTADATKLDNKLSRIIAKSLDVVEDRLENGDLVMNNKTGELVRRPVPLREASKAASELMQRQHQNNKLLVDNTIREQTIDETLKFLAGEFAKMVNKKPEIIDMVEEVPPEEY